MILSADQNIFYASNMHAALELIARSSTQTNLPDFKVGQTVRIHQKIKEGEKTRLQVFEGLIIKRGQGSGINGTITVRKSVDGIGVERVFPIHSPLIAKVEITKEGKVRRSKLYYLRDRSGKSARMKTTVLEGQIYEPKRYVEEVAAVEEVIADEVTEEPVSQDAAPQEAEVAPAPAEAPAEAAPMEAAPAEAPAETAPAETTVEEAPVVAEEAPAPVEAPAEEAPAPVEAPAEEAPAPVEAPAEEAPAPEVSDEVKSA